MLGATAWVRGGAAAPEESHGGFCPGPARGWQQEAVPRGVGGAARPAVPASFPAAWKGGLDPVPLFPRTRGGCQREQNASKRGGSGVPLSRPSLLGLE